MGAEAAAGPPFEGATGAAATRAQKNARRVCKRSIVR